MRALGILGGIAWPSTVTYYREINKAFAAAMGRRHSAPLWIASVDFEEIVEAQVAGDWQRAGITLGAAARGLERAGAGAFLIASNTMHKVYDHVRACVSIDGISIFDATAAAIRGAGLLRVALLGTRYTMSDPYFRFEYERRGIEVFPPAPELAAQVNEHIFRELVHDVVTADARRFFDELTHELADRGAEGIVLGCTELDLVMDGRTAQIPSFDTSALHAAAAAAWLIS